VAVVGQGWRPYSKPDKEQHAHGEHKQEAQEWGKAEFTNKLYRLNGSDPGAGIERGVGLQHSKNKQQWWWVLAPHNSKTGHIAFNKHAQRQHRRRPNQARHCNKSPSSSSSKQQGKLSSRTRKGSYILNGGDASEASDVSGLLKDEKREKTVRAVS
jgi:hypothetical protein